MELFSKNFPFWNHSLFVSTLTSQTFPGKYLHLSHVLFPRDEPTVHGLTGPVLSLRLRSKEPLWSVWSRPRQSTLRNSPFLVRGGIRDVSSGRHPGFTIMGGGTTVETEDSRGRHQSSTDGLGSVVWVLLLFQEKSRTMMVLTSKDFLHRNRSDSNNL